MSDITFAELGLSQPMLDSLTKKGYVFPTPIQSQVIPFVLKETNDLIAQANTGTGKTGAFGIPLLEMIDDSKPVIQGIILAPTRELAQQVANELILYKGKRPINVITICGGQSISNQIHQLKDNRSACIIVGTPGRIIDHLDRKRLNLSEVRYLVLDEVDEMLSIGFKEEIDTILADTNPNKRTLLFSATLPPYALTLAKTYLKNPTTIKAEKPKEEEAVILQDYFEVQAHDKFHLLCRIIDLNDDFYGMIFCNTKRETDELREKLVSAGYNAESLHGDLSQAQREHVLMKLKKKMCTILVVTDVASRGIDVKQLNTVVNYSVPQNAETYTHRMGRTGRAGASGYAVTFVQSNEFFKFKRMLNHLPAQKLEKQRIPGADQVIAKKRSAFAKKVLSTQPSEMVLSLAQDLLAKKDAEYLVAALVELSLKGQLDSNRYPEIREYQRGEGRGDGRGGDYRGERRGSRSDRYDRGSRERRDGGRSDYRGGNSRGGQSSRFSSRSR